MEKTLSKYQARNSETKEVVQGYDFIFNSTQNKLWLLTDNEKSCEILYDSLQEFTGYLDKEGNKVYSKPVKTPNENYGAFGPSKYTFTFLGLKIGVRVENNFTGFTLVFDPISIPSYRSELLTKIFKKFKLEVKE